MVSLRIPLPRRALAFVPAVLLLAIAFAGCPDKQAGGPDSGKADAGPVDAGPADAGPPRCTADSACASREYCDIPSGECLQARTCRDDYDCLQPAMGPDGIVDDYCSAEMCFCDAAVGSCRPRRGRCQPCAGDAECGSTAAYESYLAGCTDYQGKKVCLPKKDLGCTPGYVAQTDSPFCAPVGGSCDAQFPCISDAECDALGPMPVCDTMRGICVKSCLFDYQTGQSSCPPGQVCHVDGRLLTANNPNFGGGKCGAGCDGAGAFACSTGTACTDDGDPVRVSPLVRRCRPPPPKCVRDADCPADPDGHSWGYCDRATLGCKGGCRADSDCNAGYACENRVCKPMGCIRQNPDGSVGGANLYCGGPNVTAGQLGQFCCGEPGGYPAADCPTGVKAGDCFDATDPPWCGDCSLQTYPTPPGTRPQESRCVTHALAAATKKIMWHACDKLARAACPARWQCEAWIQWCDTDADCDGSQGSCADIDMGDTYGKAKGCVCNNGQACPAPSQPGKDRDGNDTGICESFWCTPRYCFPQQGG